MAAACLAGVCCVLSLTLLSSICYGSPLALSPLATGWQDFLGVSASVSVGVGLHHYAPTKRKASCTALHERCHPGRFTVAIVLFRKRTLQ